MTPVKLPVPPSVNSIWRVVKIRNKARVTLSKAYRTWIDEAVLLLRSRMDRVAVYPVAVRVTIVRGAGWKKGRDADNCLKVISDALVRAGRIVDDSEDYVSEFTVRFGGVAETACALVSVDPVEVTA